MSSSGHAGRPKSWVAVSIMFIGFLVAGLALPIGPLWVMFWIGAAIVVTGGVLALVFDVMTDVVLAQPYLSRDPAKREQDLAAIKATDAATGRTADSAAPVGEGPTPVASLEGQ